MTPQQHLVFACCTLVLLTATVGITMLKRRIKAMKQEQIHPQTIALSSEKSDKLLDTRASDNFTNLFEVPVLFYALCAMSIATNHTPFWLSIAAWSFVALRFLHSYIQCTNNQVMLRFKVFLAGFFLLISMWLGFSISLFIV